jgi:CBS domain-containing protein
MLARDIMTSNVLTVKPDTTIGEIASLMTTHHISGVPVVDDDGRMIGIVSETDLLHRAQLGTERKRKWWISLFIDPDMRARDFIKGHGDVAADVMSRFIVSTHEDATLSEVADLLDANDLKRLPVLRAGKLVGMITRGDLVRVIARSDVASTTSTGDSAQLQKALNKRIAEQRWADPGHLNVIATDEAVELWGFVASEDQRRALLILVREMAGKRSIEDHLVLGPRHFSTTT